MGENRATAFKILEKYGKEKDDEGDVFLKSLVPQGFVGIPAVHLEDDAGICLGQSLQKLKRHAGLETAFRTAAAQTIAQRKITRADIGAKYPITEYLFTPPDENSASPSPLPHLTTSAEGGLCLFFRFAHLELSKISKRRRITICKK